MENLEWQWKDLEVGDKVKFRKELLNYYITKGYGAWAQEYEKKILYVIRINNNNTYMEIEFRNGPFVNIDFNGDMSNYNSWSYRGPVFNIVELKED